MKYLIIVLFLLLISCGKESSINTPSAEPIERNDPVETGYKILYKMYVSSECYVYHLRFSYIIYREDLGLSEWEFNEIDSRIHSGEYQEYTKEIIIPEDAIIDYNCIGINTYKDNDTCQDLTVEIYINGELVLKDFNDTNIGTNLGGTIYFSDFMEVQ